MSVANAGVMADCSAAYSAYKSANQCP
jgi:hypothetical protein